MEHFLTKKSDLYIFVEIKTSGRRRIFDMVKCYTSLGTNVCKAFPFFHCFAGADSTTSYFKVSEKVWFSSWMKFPYFNELCKVFIQMSNCPMKNVVINSLHAKETKIFLDNILMHEYGSKSINNVIYYYTTNEHPKKEISINENVKNEEDNNVEPVVIF